MGIGSRNLIEYGHDFLYCVNDSRKANEAESVQNMRDAVKRCRRDLKANGAGSERDEAERAHAAKRAKRKSSDISD